MEDIEYKIIIKKASEGMFLTQKNLSENEIRIFVTQITVTEETKDNYREATIEEKNTYEETLNLKNLNENEK